MKNDEHAIMKNYAASFGKWRRGIEGATVSRKGSYEARRDLRHLVVMAKKMAKEMGTSKELRKHFEDKCPRRCGLEGAFRKFGYKALAGFIAGDGEYFRRLAVEIEAPWVPYNHLKFWLHEKHTPGLDGVPKFTSTELLADAESRGISISQRHLTELMKKCGYKTKHARR